MRNRNIFVIAFLSFIMLATSSCVSRIMYEDGQFDQSDLLEDADDIQLLNSEINQDDAFHD
ncbi:MAG: hypothetical protein Q4B68_09050 [Bacteroidales bacterium]|nr:hypothetical protein [Bacteroidales bacterium]